MGGYKNPQFFKHGGSFGIYMGQFQPGFKKEKVPPFLIPRHKGNPLFLGKKNSWPKKKTSHLGPGEIPGYQRGIFFTPFKKPPPFKKHPQPKKKTPPEDFPTWGPL